MAAGKISFVKTQGVWGFTALLVSAVCEWFLIILLLFDALLSYLLTKFASFCRLQAPCILCSRLDFALGGQKSELYQTLLCNNHISEITSLLPCHIHNKVADGVGMCDDCLLSFTAKTKANSKAHRLLVGKLGLFHGDCSFQCSLKDDLFSGSSDSRPCTCCGSITSHFVGKNSRDSLCYSGFAELKLHPESEFPFSADDNNVSTVIHENNEAGSDPKCQCTPIASSKFLPSDSSTAEPGKNKAVDVSQASDNGLQSIRDHGGSFMKIAINAELFEKTDLVVSDSSHTSLRHKDREELKLSSHKSSQDSSTSLVIPLDDAYPPKKKADAASSNGTKVLQKSVSLDSGLGSMSGSIVSRIEEDSLVDQLKRQLTYDKQFINSLHKELEEERNASAIAANEAMAMITKLQEDKAALRMEALQYLRMMEEQAEHDAVALEKADDLLSEKEKMIQDLEAELDFYRLNLVEEPMDENMHEEGNHFNAANMTLQNVGLPHITNSINSSCNSIQAQNS
ncbi:myosin-binding protein 1-like [Neltuma alba]|uniref:myosin-binding protein 1-like n=1 Tax=Neltuma alba TaxID=207710 RepID=UPI0010A2B07D|nr:myosin-binding protein 1-like [Prosopis alba]